MSVRNISVVLSANTAALSAGLTRGAAQVRAFGADVQRTVTSTDRDLRKISQTAGMVGVGIGAGIGAGFVQATRAALDFEKTLKNVQTVLSVSTGPGIRGVTGGEMSQVGQEILDLSRRVPQSARALSEALYEIGSSGFSLQKDIAGASEAMSVLDATAVVASAGLTDADTAVRAVTIALNAYGKSGFEANAVIDTLFQTVNVGALRMTDLAQQLGDVVGGAASAGVSLEEVGSAMAALTLAGLPAAEAATSLNQLIRELVDPSEELAARMHELKLSTESLRDPSIGLYGVMTKLIASTKGNRTELNMLFREQRALRGAQMLGAADGRLYADSFDKIADASKRAGAAQQAFDTQMESAANQIQLARNQITASAIEVGTQLLPALASTAQFVGSLALGFSSLPEPVQSATTGFVGLVGASALLGGSWTLLMRHSSVLRAAMGGLEVQAARLGLSMGGLGLATAGIGLVVGKTISALGELKRAQLEEEQAVKTLTEAYYQEAVGIDGVVIATARRALMDSGALEAGRRLGVRTADLIAAYLGEEDAINRVNAAMEKRNNIDDRQAPKLRALGGGNLMPKQPRSQDAQDIDKVAAAVEGATEKNAEAKEVAVDLADAERQLSPAIRGVGAAAAGAAGGVAGFGGASGDAANKVDYLAASLKGLSAAQRATAKAMAGAAPTLSGVLSAAMAAQDRATSGAAAGGKSAAQRANDVEAAQIGVARAQLRLIDSTRALNRVRSESMAPGLARAERDLAAAQDSTMRSAFHLIDAERALAEARDPRRQARTQQEAEIAIGRARMANLASIQALSDAQERLGFAREGGDPREIAESERALQATLYEQREAAWRMIDAQEALGRLREDGSRAAIEAEMDLRDAQRATAESQQAATDSAAALATARHAAVSGRAVVEAELELRDAILGVAQAHEAVQESMASNTGGSDTFVTKTDAMTLSLSAFETELNNQLRTYEGWSADLDSLTGRTSNAVIAHFSKLGITSAGIVSQLADSSDADLARMTASVERAMLGQSEAFNGAMLKFRQNGKLTRDETSTLLAALVQELGISFDEARRLLRQYGGDLADAAGAPVIEWRAGRLEGANGRPGMPVGRANGGVDAGIHHRQLIKFAEPETGGELYLPRRGISRDRAAMLLAAGADWYGLGVTAKAMAKGGTTLPLPPSFRAMWADPVAMPPQRVADAWHDAATRMGGKGGPLGAAPGWRAMMEALHQVFPGLRLISGLRPGAITATGRPSYHGMGRAVDLPPRRDVFDWIAANYGAPTRELIFSPAGGRQIHNGRPHYYGEPTRGNHFDHVHWAMRHGGVLPVRSYDSGGFLPLGTSVAVNGTGRPEPVGHHLAQQPAGRVVTVENSGNITVNVRAEVGADAGRLATEIRRQVEPVVAGAMRSLTVELEQS